MRYSFFFILLTVLHASATYASKEVIFPEASQRTKRAKLPRRLASRNETHSASARPGIQRRLSD